MRTILAVALTLVFALVPARAGEEADAAERVPSGEALGFLRTFMRHVREGDHDAAWAPLDAEALAHRAFEKILAAAPPEARAGVVDLVRQGIPALTSRAPPTWTDPDVVFDDLRADPYEDDLVEVGFSYGREHADPESRWSLVLRAGSEGPRIVDLVLRGGGGSDTCAAILLREYEGFAKQTGDADLGTWLRLYFGLFLPATVVPEDAPVDWASPDAMALDIEEPLVPGAAADGWHGSPLPGNERLLVYRGVLHLQQDGTLHWRWDWTRQGGATPFDTVSLPEDAVDLGLTTGPLLLAVLVRADGRAPWASLRALLGALPPEIRNRTAFAVRRAEADGPPRHGQLPFGPEGGVPVVASRGSLEARRGFARPRPTAATPRDGAVVVEILRRPDEAGRPTTWVEVPQAAAKALPRTTEGAARAEAIAAVVAAVEGALGEARGGRVVIRIPSPAGDDVPHEDVVHVLAALRRLRHAIVEIDVPPADAAPTTEDPGPSDR